MLVEGHDPARHGDLGFISPRDDDAFSLAQLGSTMLVMDQDGGISLSHEEGEDKEELLEQMEMLANNRTKQNRVDAPEYTAMENRSHPADFSATQEETEPARKLKPEAGLTNASPNPSPDPDPSPSPNSARPASSSLRQEHKHYMLCIKTDHSTVYPDRPQHCVS